MEKDNIMKLIKELNSKENLPKLAFRRNAPIYELVCYINNIIACYLSGNYEPIPVFVQRSNDFIREVSVDHSNEQYFGMIKYFLKEIKDEITV